MLPASKGNPAPIKPERLQGWWKAAVARPGAAADGLRLMLLTGCRPGEIFGSVYAPGLLVQDVDLAGARMVLPDTKNRTDHTVLLSTQALAILAANCKDKKPGAKVFDLVDPGKALDAINRRLAPTAPVRTSCGIRSPAWPPAPVNAFALKAMMNHGHGGDVTGRPYVQSERGALRAAWQAVADTICG